MNTNGAVQRAELFANVDELMAWKKSFDRKQIEMIQWQAMILDKIMELHESDKTIIQGCMTMMETDTMISESTGLRCDELSKRIDIVNKRLRRLEDAVKELANEKTTH